MTEKFILTGIWYLPSTKDRTIHGTLIFDPHNNRIELSILGTLNNDNRTDKDSEIILGVTTDNKKITLYKYFNINTTHNLSNSFSSIITQYSIMFLLIGQHVESSEQLKFNSISTEIFNLDEWIGISGFKVPVELFFNNEVSIHYKKPESINFEIDGFTKVEFRFFLDPPKLTHYLKTVTLTQRVEVKFVSLDLKNIDELLLCLNKFQIFLSIALYKDAYPLSITLENVIPLGNDSINEKASSKAKLYLLLNNRFGGPPRYNFQMIFDYTKIRSIFPEIIKNWYLKFELINPAINLLSSTFINSDSITINNFLNLAQSIESFHARLYPGTKLPKDKYSKMKSEILNQTSPDYHTWLNEQFKFGNNLTLQYRLEQIFELYSNSLISKLVSDKAKFIQNIKNSRNYYTHYSKSLEKKALKGDDLFHLTEKLKLLLISALLIEIGFDGKILLDLMKKAEYHNFNFLK